MSRDFYGGGGSGGVAGRPTSPGSSGQPDFQYQQQQMDIGGGNRGPYQQQDGQMPNKGYRFSQEEMRAIKECNKESFYYRCLPIGTAMGCGTFFAVKHGYLKPNPRFGAGPKMFAASFLGYFIGKFSYQQACAEKLMALPNSHLGEMLRKRKGQGQGMGFQESLSLESMYAPAAPAGSPAFPNTEFGQSHVYSDVGDTRPLSSFDSEGTSSVSGYDLNQYSSPSNYDTTQQMLDDENLPPKRPQYSTTYDDLRRQNRVEFESKQYSRNPPASAPTTDSSHPELRGDGSRNYPGPSGSHAPNDSRTKNKYGDMWDDKPTNY